MFTYAHQGVIPMECNEWFGWRCLREIILGFSSQSSLAEEKFAKTSFVAENQIKKFTDTSTCFVIKTRSQNSQRKPAA